MGDTANVLNSVLVSFLLGIAFSAQLCNATDTISASQSIKDGESLISAGGVFVLGFFNPDGSQNRYVGIRYNKISDGTIVWIANRDNPVTDSSGVLKIGNDGNLMVLNGTGSALWSTNVSVVAKNPTARLLDSGNLVLREGQESENIPWQSFDYPTDTMLPGMKLGLDLKTGMNWTLTSWKNLADPSSGDFSSGIDPSGLPQMFVWYRSDPVYRAGSWNGLSYTGVPEMKASHSFNFSFIINQEEIYYSFSVINSSTVTRLVMNQSGVIQRYIWNEGRQVWVLLWFNPKDQCEDYRVCGPFGSCNRNNWPYCSCVQGFEPISTNNWNTNDFSEGCVRKTPLRCGNGDGFLLLRNMKLPDTSVVDVDESLSLEECKIKCMNNCSCTAFANSNISGEGSGCITWSGDLMDLREFINNGQDLYVRLAASDLGGKDRPKIKRWVLMLTIVVFLALLLLGFGGLYFWRTKMKGKDAERKEETQEFPLFDLKTEEERKCRNNDSELPLFDLCVVADATNNFSNENKLGEGGFGPVYKGKLEDGREIAVKRLSIRSLQGQEEFKNEVILILKLQHRNLVKLLGCCIQGDEKILIYEYMPNKSLDFFLFDQTKSKVIDWGKRFNIIIGIARGLLYLHQDSRLRIIHRDLKASNILLDDQMNPKISDFGMAKIFGENQIHGNTSRVVGTYGYMSPEYMMDGLFSVKSDVFSFGVLLLEIVSGRNNRGFCHPHHSLNLLGHAWNLWKEEKGLELMDPSVGESCSTREVLRCIQVGLLCVQEYAIDRPTISSVVFMLGSETTILPPPKQPAFSLGRTLIDSSSTILGSHSINEVTTTVIEPR